MESTSEICTTLEPYDIGDLYFTINASNAANAEHQLIQFLRIATREYGKEYGILDYDFIEDPSI